MLAKLFGGRGVSPYRNLGDQMQGFMTFGASSLGVKENIEDDFLSVVQKAYKQSGPVFACILARAMPFSEARFQFQHLENGRPTDLWGTNALSLLENPWTNGTTGELLWKMEQFASLAGNFFATPVMGRRTGKTRIRVLRPDWVTIVSGVYDDPEASPYDLDAEVLGYIYQPFGTRVPDPVFITPERMIHYSPIPDPEAQWRGMSWITPLVDEIMGDRWAQKHKTKFFENGTVASMAVVYEGTRPPEKIREFRKIFDESYAGADNAYRVIHMGGGADIKALGAGMQHLDFSALSGSAETRIAAAAGVGSIIARFSEGMDGSSLNSGNYNSAKRQYADMTLRPLWRTTSASLSKPAIVVVPGGSRLWYDVRDIEFLKEDRKDAAEILTVNATTMRTLVEAGWKPDDVVKAVSDGNLASLSGKHTGRLSVQLQEPGVVTPAGTAVEPPAPIPALNP